MSCRSSIRLASLALALLPAAARAYFGQPLFYPDAGTPEDSLGLSRSTGERPGARIR